METNALYNVFRPKTFSDIVGQEHISEVLRNQVKNNQAAHAYLFCGTRGTGKTTTSKVLAKAVNCLNPKDGEPCGECEMCKKIDKGLSIDVIEMDAASHRKIDDMRNIIETLKYPPTEARIKVFILDEVHMLTSEASNAFLKTLEEPPANVIFILATTDPQKLPVTILSRCQKYEFRRISTKKILSRLKYVCEHTSIEVEEEGLELIAKIADGALRDSLSLLDRIKGISASGEPIKYTQVLDILGAASKQDMFDISSSIFKRDVLSALNIVQKLDEQGKDFGLYTKDLIKFMRNILMAKVITVDPGSVIPMAKEDIEKLKQIASITSKEDMLQAIKILQDNEIIMRNSSQVRVLLELAIIQIAGSKDKQDSIPVQDTHDHRDSKNEQSKIEDSCSKDSHNKMLSVEEIANKVKQSKVFVINTLKKNDKPKLRDLGIALERCSMKLSHDLEIKIIPNGEKDKKIILVQYRAIEKGFKSFLEKENIKVKVNIEK